MGFDKFWRSGIHTKHIFQHQYLTITRQRRPNPNSRCLDILGNLIRQTLNHPLKNKSKGTSRTDRPSISFIPGPAIGIAALGLKSPHSMARLRCQAYTSHHWNTALGQETDGVCHAGTTFKFHRATTVLFRHPCGISKRNLRAFRIRTKGHIDQN